MTIAESLTAEERAGLTRHAQAIGDPVARLLPKLLRIHDRLEQENRELRAEHEEDQANGATAHEHRTLLGTVERAYRLLAWGKSECEPALSDFPDAAEAWLTAARAAHPWLDPTPARPTGVE